jgi:hypothetical protein
MLKWMRLIAERWFGLAMAIKLYRSCTIFFKNKKDYGLYHNLLMFLVPRDRID